MENPLDLRMGWGESDDGKLGFWYLWFCGLHHWTPSPCHGKSKPEPQGKEVTWFVMHLSLQFSLIPESSGPDVYFTQGREEWWGPRDVTLICIWTEEKKVSVVTKGRGLWPKPKRASGVTGGSAVASMHPYMCPCPWLISSPWVWVGFTDLLLMNRIWQKQWD